MTRPGSLRKDKEDIIASRHHRSKNFGTCVSWEYCQSQPFFFTRENSQVNIIGNYRGASAFMICNGLRSFNIRILSSSSLPMFFG